MGFLVEKTERYCRVVNDVNRTLRNFEYNKKQAAPK